MATATDGGITTTIPKGREKTVMTRGQLAELFEKKGYSANIIKTATKATKLTAQLLTELYGAWSRVPVHPVTAEFLEGDWSELCKVFKDIFVHDLPDTAPSDRTVTVTNAVVRMYLEKSRSNHARKRD